MADPRAQAAVARKLVEDAFRRTLRGSRIGLMIGGSVFLLVAAAALACAVSPRAWALVFGPLDRPVVSIILFGALFAVGGLFFFRGAGAMRPPDARLLAEGRPGRATLREVKGAGMTVGQGRYGSGYSRLRLVLDVTVNGGAPYAVTHKTFVPPGGYKNLRPGTELAVRVDPLRPKRLAVEWA